MQRQTYRVVNEMSNIAVVAGVNSELAVIAIKVQIKQVCKQFGVVDLSSLLSLFVCYYL